MSTEATIPQMAARIAAAGKRAGLHVRRDSSYKSDSQYVYWTAQNADMTGYHGQVKFRVSDHANNYGEDMYCIDIRRAEQVPTAMAIALDIIANEDEWQQDVTG